MMSQPRRGVVTGSKRGPYKKANIEANQRILNAANNQQDWQTVARNNGVALHTARNLILRGEIAPKPRGGRREAHVKMTPAIIDHTLNLLENNSQITLKQIKESINFNFNVVISISCIANSLASQTWTVKKITNEPIAVNSIQNKHLRANFVNEIMRAMAQNKVIFYEDETNLNLFTQRTVGRAPVGQRARRLLPNSKGPNVHCIGVYGQLGGLQYFERRRGAFKKIDFQEYFVRMLNNLQQLVPLNNTVIVIDNAPNHIGIEEFIAEHHPNLGIQILRLGPYSAPLSPIELFWSSFKASAKRRLAERSNEITGAPQVGMTQTEHRLQILENIIDLSIAEANQNPQNSIK